MGDWMNDTLRTGAVAAAATTAAVALLSRAENGSASEGLNAVSHILWGDEALGTDACDVRHTVAGAGLNAAAVTSWAGIHEMMMPRGERPSVGKALLAGAATSALAFAVDFHVVPKRLTPGFEEKLSRGSLLGVYAVLALALAAGSLCRGK